MRVIKEGNKDKLKGTKVFECQYCDCVFEADSTEYWGGDARDPDYYASCPCCHSGCSEKKNYVPDPEPKESCCSDSTKGYWVPETCREAFGGDDELWYACGDPVATYFCSECHNECYIDEFGKFILSKFCPFCGVEMNTEEE